MILILSLPLPSSFFPSLPLPLRFPRLLNFLFSLLLGLGPPCLFFPSPPLLSHPNNKPRLAERSDPCNAHVAQEGRWLFPRTVKFPSAAPQARLSPSLPPTDPRASRDVDRRMRGSHPCDYCLVEQKTGMMWKLYNCPMPWAFEDPNNNSNLSLLVPTQN
ncbi:hypothetical protein HOY82DRAFT_564591 [Tuber indicum]|nr:hypothetical protein HOY82DRAFT_564591 [Tuber indicum]